MYEFYICGKAYQFDLDNLLLYDDTKKSYCLNWEAKSPKNRVYFKLTRSCNLKCTYCFQKMDKKVFPEVKLEIYSNVIDKLINQDNTDFYIFGGEPFLDSQYENIKYILERSSQEFFVFTNGSYSKKYQSLITQYCDRLKLIITLDGTEKTHNLRRRHPTRNSFQMIIENLDFLQQIKANITLQINVDPHNLNDIFPLLEFIDVRYGLNNLNIILNPVLHCFSEPFDVLLLEKYVELNLHYDLSRCVLNNKVLKKIIDILTGKGVNTKRCNVEKTSVYDFESNKVYCCPQDENTVIGYIKKDQLVINRNIYYNEFQYNQKLLEPCRDCKYRVVCGYGCFVEKCDYSKCKLITEQQLHIIFKNISCFLKASEYSGAY